MRRVKKIIKTYYLKHITTCFLACCMFFGMPISDLHAAPQGAEVVNGQVSIQQSGSNTRH